MATEKLSVKITADAKNFSSELSKMYKQLDEAKGKFEGLSKAGDSMKNVGKKLTAGLTLPIAGVAGASVKTAADFEASMNKVSATSGATGSDLEKLSKLAKDMGASKLNSWLHFKKQNLEFVFVGAMKTEHPSIVRPVPFLVTDELLPTE